MRPVVDDGHRRVAICWLLHGWIFLSTVKDSLFLRSVNVEFSVHKCRVLFQPRHKQQRHCNNRDRKHSTMATKQIDDVVKKMDANLAEYSSVTQYGTLRFLASFVHAHKNPWMELAHRTFPLCVVHRGELEQQDVCEFG